MIYRVKRLMMYDGRQYERGAVWEPTGHPNDASIIRSGMVYEEAAEEKGAPSAPESEGDDPGTEEATAPALPRRGRPPKEG